MLVAIVVVAVVVAVIYDSGLWSDVSRFEAQQRGFKVKEGTLQHQFSERAQFALTVNSTRSHPTDLQFIWTLG